MQKPETLHIGHRAAVRSRGQQQQGTAAAAARAGAGAGAGGTGRGRGRGWVQRQVLLHSGHSAAGCSRVQRVKALPLLLCGQPSPVSAD